MTDQRVHESETIPKGKLVLLIDDDVNFRRDCMKGLGKALSQLEPDKDDLQFLGAGSLEKFEALIGMVRVNEREKDLIYALADLKLPLTEGGRDDKAEYGQAVLRKLRELKVPTLLLSSAGANEIDEVFREDQHRYWPKTELDDERKVREVVVQILCARDRAPFIDLTRCDDLRSPVQVRGQTRKLPLAFQSLSMQAVRSRVLGKAAPGGAAVLLLGEPGVEFEQLAWLLFYEIAKNRAAGGQRGEYQYIEFDCYQCETSPIELLEAKPGDPGELPRYLFFQNVHALESAQLKQFCDALARSSAVRVGGDRVVLAAHLGGDLARASAVHVDGDRGSWTADKGEDEGASEGSGAERLLDLFCLAGFDDFILLEVPPLSRQRCEDIAVYAEYYRRQRMEDRHESTLVFHQRGLSLIKDLDYPRHFKQLSIFLDRLFRAAGGGMINAQVVRSVLPTSFVEAAFREVLDHILTVDGGESETGASWSPGRLQEMCSQFLVNRDDRDSQSSPEDDEALNHFYQELETIAEALQRAASLEKEEKTLFQKQVGKQGSDFWPWSRYPVCPRLLKQLRHHGLTVGLVSHSSAKP